MSKIAERLLTFFIGIPLIVACAAFSFCNHLLLHLAILATTIIISYELHGILSKSMQTQSVVFTTILSSLIPLITTICVIFNLPEDISSVSFIIIVFIILVREIWGYDKSTVSFEKSNQRLASSFIIVFYCGFLMSFISRMTAFQESSAIVSLFLLLIFGCDSCAWFFGITMGKNNRGILKASPNKSLMGFIGGYAGPYVSIAIALFFFPILKAYPFWKLAVLAFAVSTTSIIGDLVESVMKRSSNVKDSGNIIPGRGGLLDSADSIVFSAPVYFFLVKLLLGI